MHFSCKRFFDLLLIERKISRTIFFGGQHFLNLFYKMECKFLKCDSRYNFCFPWNQMQPFIFQRLNFIKCIKLCFCLFCGKHSKSFSSQVKKVFSVEKFEKRLVAKIFCKLISSSIWYFHDEIQNIISPILDFRIKCSASICKISSY